jgi:hypothetical protein
MIGDICGDGFDGDSVLSATRVIPRQYNPPMPKCLLTDCHEVSPNNGGVAAAVPRTQATSIHEENLA